MLSSRDDSSPHDSAKATTASNVNPPLKTASQRKRKPRVDQRQATRDRQDASLPMPPGTAVSVTQPHRGSLEERGHVRHVRFAPNEGGEWPRRRDRTRDVGKRNDVREWPRRTCAGQTTSKAVQLVAEDAVGRASLFRDQRAVDNGAADRALRDAQRGRGFSRGQFRVARISGSDRCRGHRSCTWFAPGSFGAWSSIMPFAADTTPTCRPRSVHAASRADVPSRASSLKRACGSPRRVNAWCLCPAAAGQVAVTWPRRWPIVTARSAPLVVQNPAQNPVYRVLPNPLPKHSTIRYL